MITPLDKRPTLNASETEFLQAFGVINRTAKEGQRGINLNDISLANECFFVGDLRSFTKDVLKAESLLRKEWKNESSP